MRLCDNGFCETTPTPPSCLNVDDTSTIYGREFTDEREGIYHYAVFGHDSPGSHWGFSYGHLIWIDDADIEGWFGGAKEEQQAHTFLHELGHHFGLSADHFWASATENGEPDEPIDDDDYPSCMRYGAENGDKGYLDYSSKQGELNGLYKDLGNGYVEYGLPDGY